MINFKKLKYKAIDASIVLSTVGAIGVISYLIASTLSKLDKISLDEDDIEDEPWWN